MNFYSGTICFPCFMGCFILLRIGRWTGRLWGCVGSKNRNLLPHMLLQVLPPCRQTARAGDCCWWRCARWGLHRADRRAKTEGETCFDTNLEQANPDEVWGKPQGNLWQTNWGADCPKWDRAAVCWVARLGAKRSWCKMQKMQIIPEGCGNVSGQQASYNAKANPDCERYRKLI